MSETMHLRVGGMSCAHCARAVAEAIQRQDPGAVVAVEVAAGTVRATTRLPRGSVAAAIAAEGYEVIE